MDGAHRHRHAWRWCGALLGAVAGSLWSCPCGVAALGPLSYSAGPMVQAR